MPTLGEMKAQIADDLVRDDIGSQIAASISRAIRVHQSTPFWFTKSRGVRFYTEAGQWNYGANNSIPEIGLIINVDRVLLTHGTDGDFSGDFDESDFDVGELTGAVVLSPARQVTVEQDRFGSGEPMRYSFFNGRFYFSPTPDDAYPITVLGDVQVSEPNSDNQEGNAWMNEAGGLIYAEAKRYLAVHTLRNTELAADMAGEVAREKRELTLASNRKDATYSLEPAEPYCRGWRGDYGRPW
jgi:hypothetical protein